MLIYLCICIYVRAVKAELLVGFEYAYYCLTISSPHFAHQNQSLSLYLYKSLVSTLIRSHNNVHTYVRVYIVENINEKGNHSL